MSSTLLHIWDNDSAQEPKQLSGQTAGEISASKIHHPPDAKIVEIAFGLISSAEIRRRAVAEVTSATLEERGYPKEGGPNDLRAGTMNRMYLCQTCEKNCTDCQGHALFVELPLPVLNISLVPMIVRVLRCVCFGCSKLRVPPHAIAEILDEEESGLIWKTHRQRRLPSISDNLRKRKTCLQCGYMCPDISAKGATISWCWSAKNIVALSELQVLDPNGAFVPDGLSLAEPAMRQKLPMDNSFIRACLLSISDDEYRQLGLDPVLAHPANGVMETMLIPPPSVRPSVRYSESSKHRSEHDFTVWIQEIVRAKSRLLKLLKPSEAFGGTDGVNSDSEQFVKSPGANGQKRRRLVGIRQATKNARNARNNRSEAQLKQLALDELTGIICGYINCDSSAAKSSASTRHRATQQNRSSLMTVQSGKAGQWRGNTQGKRIDYSGRTVACPTVSLDPQEVGFPERFGHTLTIPSTVQSYNIELLRTRVRIGAGRLDGAISVILPNGITLSLQMLDSSQRRTLAAELTFGLRVEHPMANGDRVIQNRQPTLRRASMMSHQVYHEAHSKVERVNTAVVGASNTDFDGDALNCHEPQGLEARAEVKELMAVEKQIISAQSHKPLFGLIQDTIVGSYRLTADNVSVDREEAMQCVAQASRHTVADRFMRRHTTAAWISGKDLFSTLLPDGFNFSQQVQRDTGVEAIEIINGRLIRGRLCKRTLGATSLGIVHSLTRLCGEEAAMNFLGDAQRVVGWWLSQHALSIGLRDCLISISAAQEVSHVVNSAIEEADEISREGAITGRERDLRHVGRVETDVSARLRKVLAQAGTIALQAAPNNNGNPFKDTVDSGAKGTVVNLSQVLCCVGQQNTQGARIGQSMERTLSSFPNPTTSSPSSVKARGFVASSFSAGLSPSEMFFHFSASWDALMDTSVRTSLSGYGQRKMTKAAEDVTIRYDGTVRHSNGTVVDFVYGSDGMDSARLDPVAIPELASDFVGNGRANGDPETMALLAECRAERVSFVDAAPGSCVYLPFSASRRLAQFPLPDPSLPTAPKCVLTLAKERLERLCHTLGVLEQGRRTLYRTTFLRLHIRMDLEPSRVAERLRTKEQVNELFDQLEDLYFRACVEAGEAAGLLAAENIAEPLTQLVLNAFHTTGEGSIASTQGIPRLNELIDATARIKTPVMALFYAVGREEDAAAVRLPQSGIEVFVKEAHVFVQPGGLYTSAGLAHEDGLAATELSPSFLNEQRLVIATTGLLQEMWQKEFPPGMHGHSPFVIVLILDDEQMQSLTSGQVAALIRTYLGTNNAQQSLRVFIEASAPGMRNRFVRIRITNTGDIADKCQADLRKKHPGWSEHRCARARHELFHFMTHSLCRQILTRVKVGRMAAIVGASVVVPNDRLSRYPDEPRVATAGTSLRESWDHDEFEWKRSFSNDVHEVENVLGVEAAALCLFKELRDIISAGGGSIADRHIEIIVAIMTCSGTFTPLSRFGDARLGATSAIVRASFEQQNAHIVDAAVYAESAPVNSLADSIVVGRRPPIGTGVVCLLMDPQYVKKVEDAYSAKLVEDKKFQSSAGGLERISARLFTDSLDSRERERAKLDVFERGTARLINMPWKESRGQSDGRHVPTFDISRRVDPSEILGHEQVRRFTLTDSQKLGPGLQGCLAGKVTAPMLTNEQMQKLLKFKPSSPKITSLSAMHPSAQTDATSKTNETSALDMDSIANLLESLGPMIKRLDNPLYYEDGTLNDQEFKELVMQIM